MCIRDSSNTTGDGNTASGFGSLFNNTVGSANTSLGYNSLSSNVAGSNATAIGYNAMYYAYDGANPYSNYNVAVGYEAFKGSSTCLLYTSDAADERSSV